jgi:hypothetical protein
MRYGDWNQTGLFLKDDLQRRLGIPQISVVIEREGGAQVGVTCKWYFRGRREDPHSFGLALFRRKDKSRFGEIEFMGDLLHLFIAQITGFWNDCELIPLKSVFGEDVTDKELIGHQRNRSFSNRKLWHPSAASRIQRILSERNESFTSLDLKSQRRLSWTKRRNYTISHLSLLLSLHRNGGASGISGNIILWNSRKYFFK